ncbi:MAG: hypothetical protein ABMA25_18325 [Ilumatobacteraceae bacterium]
MADAITYRRSAWDRWFSAVFAVVWVGILLVGIAATLGEGNWLIVPLLVPFGAVAPWFARRTWRAGLRLDEREMVMTPLIGRTVSVPRTQVRSFQQINSAWERGPWWSLQATIADGRQIDTKVGAWLPTRKGRVLIETMVATANAWVLG